MTEDEEEAAREREIAKLLAERHFYVSPNCCEVMRRCKSIVITVSGTPGDVPRWWLRLESNYSSRHSLCNDLIEAERVWEEVFRKRFAEKFAVKPNTWTEEDAANYRIEHKPFYPDPTHCPYCGTRLSAIVKKTEVPSPLHQGEDYCDTCGERAMNCVCFPPWAAWEPAAVEYTVTVDALDLRGVAVVLARMKFLDQEIVRAGGGAETTPLQIERQILGRLVRS